MEISIFTPDIATDKPEISIPRTTVDNPAGILRVSDTSRDAWLLGEEFSREISRRWLGDFEKAETDKMVHVSTFRLIDGMIYMSYYANTADSAENPEYQTARFAYCPADNCGSKTVLDVLSVGDTLSGMRVSHVYDTIFAQVDENTLILLWTAMVGGRYYRLFRPFDIPSKTLGDIGVNRFRVGAVTNDFSTTGIVSALTKNGIGHRELYSDIGIMQKFTPRTEQGETWYYTGAYSGDLNMIIKSRDFITWEYVSSPDFPNASKWENATYVTGDKCYYFVRQHDWEACGFLTSYDLVNGIWEQPVLIEDCQSRSDFIEHNGNLYLIHAPINREHIGIVRVDRKNLAHSREILIADMHGSCFYPFVEKFRDSSYAMSYTVNRQHIRLGEFDGEKYLI